VAGLTLTAPWDDGAPEGIFMSELTLEWQQWLARCMARHCSFESIIVSMVAAGFEPARAAVLVQQFVTGARPVATGRAEAFHYDAIPVLLQGNRVDAGDRLVTLALCCERPQVLLFDGVLSVDECETLMECARARLRRSTVLDPVTGRTDLLDLRRTSEGAFFALCEDDLIRRIDTRVARLMNWPLENGEGLQILHYGVGGEYRPHFDYFPPGDPGSSQHLAQAGQRVATLILYLNDVEAGGATIFPDAGLSITPRRGSALYFRYLNHQGQLDPLSLHGGAPVTRGEKWILTKWTRERRYVG